MSQPSATRNQAPLTASSRARHARLIPDLKTGERLVLLRRQHPAVLFGSLILPVVLLGAWLLSLTFMLPFIAGLQPGPLDPPQEGVRAALPSALWIVWLGLAACFVLWGAYRTLDWADDWIALTDKRLILMDKNLFFRESRREVPIDRIQNVSADYPNSLGVAFDFGDLCVDTAGIGVLEFKHMPHPREMREAIFSIQEALAASRPSQEETRKAAIRNIMHGKDPELNTRPTPPQGNSIARPALRTSFLGSLFPFSPVREESSVTWHKHWVYLLRGIAPPVLLWIASLLAWIAALALGEQGQYGPVAVGLGWVTVLLAPVCLLWTLWRWDDWRNDLYTLDQERVYDIERLPLGMREQSKETLITRVTDVTYVVPGPLAHLLNFGDVELKTPGEATQFTFHGVPGPREVQREIMDRIEQYRLKAQGGNNREIASWLQAYDEVQREEGSRVPPSST